MIAKTYCATHVGINGSVIEVEAARESGIPKIHITGLPGAIIRESKERIRTCLSNLGFRIPSERLVINLLPAGDPKIGNQYDLAIAVAMLMTENQIPVPPLSQMAFLGELTLDGRIRAVAGILSLIEALHGKKEIDKIIIPSQNHWEAGLLNSKKIFLVENLGQVIAFFHGKGSLMCQTRTDPAPLESNSTCLDNVIGQSLAKRALQISLAGRHHLLMIGSPGVGKSMLAQCTPHLLPPLDWNELLEVVKNYIHAPAQKPEGLCRPYRCPHHTISTQALLGGGTGLVRPGEVTLAHTGVLFLDEFPEFRKDILEGLREPIQNGCIHLHRVGQPLTLPARFTLIAAMNPCPCGYSLDPQKRCLCAPDRISSYRKRISGAILDRIDLCVVLSSSPNRNPVPNSQHHNFIKNTIASAIKIQKQRYANQGGSIYNGDVSFDYNLDCFQLGREENKWIDNFYDKNIPSIRSLHRLLKVSRTIADLGGEPLIQVKHLNEAWGLRCPDSHKRLFLY